jgi:hypothetical protein
MLLCVVHTTAMVFTGGFFSSNGISSGRGRRNECVGHARTSLVVRGRTMSAGYFENRTIKSLGRSWIL